MLQVGATEEKEEEEGTLNSMLSRVETSRV
jgi:hypothetical protein